MNREDPDVREVWSLIVEEKLDCAEISRRTGIKYKRVLKIFSFLLKHLQEMRYGESNDRETESASEEIS
jgi:hypothetical protein